MGEIPVEKIAGKKQREGSEVSVEPFGGEAIFLSICGEPLVCNRPSTGSVQDSDKFIHSMNIKYTQY